jgi:hypothetical protein
MATTKTTIGNRIIALEAGLDFQNRESNHLLEMSRKHHVEILHLQEELHDIKKVLTFISIGIITAFFIFIFKVW